MKRALQVYHIVNLLHIFFYGYILIRALNIANARAIIQGNSLYILIAYLVIIIGLSRYAKKIGNGLENPMKTVNTARMLHFISIVIFVLAFILFQRYDKNFILLVFLSFPIDVVAFIFAYRGSTIREQRTDLLDDFSDDKLD